MKHILIIILVIVFSEIKSQDYHFTQSDNAPMSINPAYTGNYKGNNRAILLYKDQWKSIGSPYKTYMVSYDSPIYMKRYPKNRIGVGVFAYSDKAGASNMGINQINVSGSFQKILLSNFALGVGFQGGFSQRAFNQSKLTWDSQWNNGIYDSSTPSEEPEYDQSILYGDFAAGLELEYRFSKQISALAGASIYHAQPTDFSYSNLQEPNKLLRRMNINAKGKIKTNNKEITFFPEIIINKQGPAHEIVYGSMTKYQLQEGGKFTGKSLETALYIGLFNRWNDSFILSAGFSYMQYQILASYDITISSLAKVNSKRGGFELSIIFISPYERRSKGSSLL